MNEPYIFHSNGVFEGDLQGLPCHRSATQDYPGYILVDFPSNLVDAFPVLMNELSPR